MTRELAEKYTDLHKEISGQIYEMLQLAEKIHDRSTFEMVKHLSGDFMGGIYLDILMPTVFREFPDLGITEEDVI